NQHEKLASHALDAQCHRAGGLLERGVELGNRRHVHAIDRRDDVVRAQAVARRGAARANAGDEHALLTAEARIARIERHELGPVEATQPFRLLAAARPGRRRRLIGRAHAHVDLHRLPVAHIGQGYGFAEANQADLVAQLGPRLDRLTVHDHYHAADFDAHLLARAVRLDLAHERRPDSSGAYP